MNLRTRLVLLLAALAAASSSLSGYLSYQAAYDEGLVAIDGLIETLAERLVQDSLASPPTSADELLNGTSLPAVLALTASGSIVGIVGDDGRVLAENSDRLAELTVEVEPGERDFSSRSLDDASFRVLNAGLPDGSTAVIAFPTGELQSALAMIRTRQIAIAVFVAVVAGVLGWVGIGVLYRPLRRLARAAEEAAGSRTLHAEFEVRRSGEVGDLARGLQAMIDALRVSRDQQRQLVIDASHELRTPLTTIRMNVDMLTSGRLSESDETMALRRIGVEVDELTQLSTELVELVASDAVVEDPSPVDMVGLVRSVAEHAGAGRDRSIEVDLDDDRRVVAMGSHAALERALSNLVANALKFSTPDTPITIHLEPGCVSVTNKGSGIPAVDLDHVFERFYRSDDARKLPGSGLGLSIVRQTARNHGGDAFVQNLLDGVTVGFTFQSM